MFLVRSAKVDISPRSPVPLAGFGDQGNAPFAAINDPLEVNAISLEMNGCEMVFLSFDTLSVGSRVDKVARSLFGVNCITLASHTHFAPSLDAELPNLGPVDEAYVAHVERQLEQLRHILSDQQPQPATFSLGRIEAPYAINRRRRAFGLDGKVKMRMLPNPSGPKDETATVLLLSNPDQQAPLAVFWSFACHPVSFHDTNAVSSDFCGVVREAFRSKYGADVACVFAQGFCGDVRPPTYGIGQKSVRNVLRFAVKTLLQGKCFGEFTKDEWRAWSKALASTVTSAPLAELPLAPKLEVARAEMPLADMHQSPAPDFGSRNGLDCALVQLGSALEICVLAGEPVTGIATLLPATEKTRITAGYMGHMFGYLPTSTMLAEGGYEAEGFRPGFSLQGSYKPGLSKLLSGFFSRLQARIGG